jgi:hypothetical protein
VHNEERQSDLLEALREQLVGARQFDSGMAIGSQRRAAVNAQTRNPRLALATDT